MHGREGIKVLAVCVPNEWHELGLLVFTLYLRKKGYEVIYLGGSIVAEDMDIVLNEVKPKFLFLSCTLVPNLTGTRLLVDRLSKDFPTLEIGLGGHAFTILDSNQQEAFERFLVGETRVKWDL